jgi:hypothetical protein
MFNASKTGSHSIINADKGNWFFALCSAMLLDNVYFSDRQNTPYRKEYKIPLGRPLEKQADSFKKNLPLYSRRFEKGIVHVAPAKGEAWITDLEGKTIYDKDGPK